MKKLTTILVLAWLCLNFSVQGQPPPKSSPLAPGTPVPTWLTLRHLVHYPQASVPLQKLQGKLVLLDFWQTWCKACISGMPKLEALQSRFRGSIQIFSINDQTPAVIRPFLKQNPVLSTTLLPLVMYDKILTRLFPHRYLPHLVWISPKGVYLGATSSENLTAALVEEVLRTGKLPEQKNKADDLHYDPEQPLFEAGNGGTPNYLYRSLLTGQQPGLPSQLGIKPEGGSVRIRATNVSFYQLLTASLGYSAATMSKSRVETSDEALYARLLQPDTTTGKDRLFCYQLMLSEGDRRKATRLMQQELSRYFGFEAKIDTAATPCWVLQRTDEPVRSIAVTNPRPGHNFQEKGAKVYEFRNEPVSVLANYFNTLFGGLPVIDETHYALPVSLTLGPDLHDLAALNRALTGSGFSISQESRPIHRILLNPSSLTP